MRSQIVRRRKLTCMNFKMAPEMFDELLTRVNPRITKQHIWNWRLLEPHLELAPNLHHLAWRWKLTYEVQMERARTHSPIVRGIYPDNRLKVACPIDRFVERWNFPKIWCNREGALYLHMLHCTCGHRLQNHLGKL